MIADMCSSLKIGNVVKDRACELYKDAEKYLKERKVHEACAACVYVACRIEKCPRTFKEITAVSRDTHMVIIMRCFKIIVDKLHIQQTSLDTIKPADYLERFCTNLQMSKVGMKLAQHIGQITSDKSKAAVWDGKSPISIAAAVIMFVGGVGRERERERRVSHLTRTIFFFRRTDSTFCLHLFLDKQGGQLLKHANGFRTHRLVHKCHESVFASSSGGKGHTDSRMVSSRPRRRGRLLTHHSIDDCTIRIRLPMPRTR